jgi:23S rRNA (adenine-N6)-dimethyltransferase
MVVGDRKSLAQNFLAKSRLAASLVNGSSINWNDVVYEIGPGNGKLTKELCKRAKRVIAVEKDSNLFIQLKKKFALNDNIVLYNADFLKFNITEARYKVFANIPFNITSAVVRKIVYASNPPVEAYLILQKEAAEKFIGAQKTTQFSVLVKPWFRLKIIWSFKKTDFSPVPNVDVVMLHIEKRIPPLISPTDFSIYQRFIKCGFGAWRRNLKSNYKNIFSHKQWKRLSRDLAFSMYAKPSELRFEQWLGLFEFYMKDIYRH